MTELGFEPRQFGSRLYTLNQYTTLERDWSHSVCEVGTSMDSGGKNLLLSLEGRGVDGS